MWIYIKRWRKIKSLPRHLPLLKKNSNPLKRVEREVVTAQNLLWTKMIGPLLSFIAIKASTTSPPVP